jgi:C4-dicarboxylate-specific signal transduction histidine kinase
MSIGSGEIGQAGLQFFGRMNASISHELKNVLAIIKENAGLLNDYISAAANGAPIDPQRLGAVGRRIESQTARADAIIKTMNQFAHTVDRPHQSVDLNHMLALLVSLHNRPAAMSQVRLEPQSADGPVVVATAPFILLNLLGLVLRTALQAVPAGGTMAIRVDKIPNGALFNFSGLTSHSNLSGMVYPGPQESALLTALSAQARIEASLERICVTLPLGLDALSSATSR